MNIRIAQRDDGVIAVVTRMGADGFAYGHLLDGERVIPFDPPIAAIFKSGEWTDLPDGAGVALVPPSA